MPLMTLAFGTAWSASLMVTVTASPVPNVTAFPCTENVVLPCCRWLLCADLFWWGEFFAAVYRLVLWQVCLFVRYCSQSSSLLCRDLI